MKLCAWCKLEKDFYEYTRHKRNSDGYHSYCRECVNERLVNKKRNDSDSAEKERLRDRIRYRLKKGIDLDIPVHHARKTNPNARHKNGQGYIIISRKGHPNAYRDHRIPEHIWIMSQHLKRPIRKGETIHHLNGIRDDNRIENLELWNSKHLPGQRVSDKITWCKEFLDEYGYDVIERKKDE